MSALADATEAVYRREWSKAIDPKMTPEEKRTMSSLILKAMKEQLSYFFREPVDPVLLNIPTYFEVYVISLSLHLLYSRHIIRCEKDEN